MKQDFFLPSDIDEIAKRLAEFSQELAGKTILLAGGRGFLGRYFVESFRKLNKNTLKKPVKVIILDNFITSGKTRIEVKASANFKFVTHDVSKPYKHKGPIDYILHAAGIASPFYYRTYPLETLDVAIWGTRNMLDLAKEKNARLLFFSSSEIYGDPDPKHVPTAESYRGNVSCHGPRACYDEGKRLGETLCGVYHVKFGTKTMVVRPFNIFGPGMQETDYRVMANFASCLKGGRPVRVYGSGNQTRTFCYVTDALVGFMRVLLRGLPGEAYNIGNPKPEVSMLDLVKHIEKVLGRRIKHDRVEYPESYPADEPNRRCPDIRKARLQIGYEPMVEFDDGLKRFLDWADKTYTGKLAP